MVGLQHDPVNYMKYLLLLFLVLIVGDAMCLFVSSLVDSFSVANAVASVLLAFFLLFGGYFVSASNLPKVINLHMKKFLPYCSIGRGQIISASLYVTLKIIGDRIGVSVVLL
jgi:hypothetical protein